MPPNKGGFPFKPFGDKKEDKLGKGKKQDEGKPPAKKVGVKKGK